MRHTPLILTLLLTMLSGCQQGSSPETSTLPQRYQPTPGTTWHWQLQGTVDPDRYAVDLYDIDLFDTPRTTIDRLHQRGIRVICYFSAGSWEDWRPDADRFPSDALGSNLDGWPGERWLDIRHEQIRQIMRQRLDLAAEKGCDGVEPDNVDGYLNETGFALNAEDQLTYNRFLATEAHLRGLSIALKNDLPQIPVLVDAFDFALNEQCHQFNECDAYAPFIDAGKAVLNAEYAAEYRQNPDARDILCQAAQQRGLSTLILPLELDDSYRDACFD